MYHTCEVDICDICDGPSTDGKSSSISSMYAISASAVGAGGISGIGRKLLEINRDILVMKMGDQAELLTLRRAVILRSSKGDC